MANEFKVLVGVELDDDSLAGLKKQINGKDAGDVKVNLNIEDAEKKIKSLKTQIQGLNKLKVNLNVGVGTGRSKSSSGVQSVVNGVNDAYNDLKNLAKRINSIRIQIAGLDSSKDSQRIDTLRNQLESLMATYNDTFTTFSKGFDIPKLNAVKKEIDSVESELDELWRKFTQAPKGVNTSNIEQDILSLESRLESLYSTYRNLGNGLTVGQIDNLTNSFGVASDKIDVLIAKAKDAKENLSKSLVLDLETGKFSSKYNEILRNFDKIKNPTNAAKNALKEFIASYNELGTALSQEEQDVDRNIAANNRFVQSLKKIENQLKINKVYQDDINDVKKLGLDKENFSKDIDIWLKNNSAAVEKFGKQIRDVQSRIQSCDRTELNNLKAEFKDLTKQAELANKTGLKFTDSVKVKAKQYLSYFSVASLMMEITQGVRYMFQAVQEVDKAMTELKRVTDLSATQYSDLYDELTVSAREYGVALNDIVSATADWSRAGFEANIAKGLAEVTTMYQHIADVDYDTAVQNLLTAYKGFEGELKNMFGGDTVAAVGYIGDILNELDNSYAVTAAGIGEALKRSASSLDVAGNSIQETAGMVTGITEVTQDPEKAGNALKVVSMRLRGMKGGLQELGEEVDENVENLSKMQGQVLNLTRGKVNIFDDMGEFKSTYEIMQGIASVWKELSTIEQADLLETIAGKHRANDIAALISNWNNVEKAVVSATEATGSAAREHEKYLNSIEGKINTLKATFQAFSNTVMSSDLIKFAVESLTKLLNILEEIIGTIGGLGTTGVIAGLVFLLRGNGIKDFFTTLMFGLSRNTGLLQSFGYATKNATKDLKAFMKTSAGKLFGAAAFATAIAAGISMWQAHQEKLRQERQKTIDDANAFNDSLGSFEQAYIKYADKTVLTVDEENELRSAIDGTINALGDKSGALKDAIGVQSEYASSLDKIARAELEQSQKLANKAKQDAKEQLESNAWFTESAGGLKTGTFWKQTLLGSFLPDYGDISNADFELPDVDTKEWEAIEDIVNSDSFKKYRELGMGWFENDNFRFKNKDIGLDEYVEQLKLTESIVDSLSKKASETGDDSYLDSDIYKEASESLDLMSSAVNDYVEQTYMAEKATYQLKNGIATTEEEFYAMRESVLSSAATSVEARVAIANLMNEEYADIFDLSSIESKLNYIKSVTKDIDDITWSDNKSFETLLEMKTKVNNGECTVGDYMDSINKANEAINSIEDSALQEFIRVELGLELDSDGNIEDEIKNLRDKLVRDLANNAISKETGKAVSEDVAKAFADGLSATELEAAVNLIAEGEIDLQNFDAEKAAEEIKEEAERIEAMRFTVNLDLEVENLEKLNSAVSEALSGTGLGSESMLVVTNMFKGLDNYDPSKLFERTANGIRMNTDEFRKMNNEYKKTNLDGLNKKMSALGDEYLETREELSDLTYGTEEYYAKAGELSSLEAQINATETLITQYEGLTSAYNEWQMAEEAGNQRDMYESVIEGLETVKDEISRGWVDDGTVEFLELLTGKDLSSGNLNEIESAYKSLGKTIENTSYSVKDFFTVNEDGESTSKGVYNFLDAVGQLEEEAFGGLDIVKRDKDGNIISFDFRIAGGDKAIADALGISEELVGIMVRAADDAGFVVSMDGTYQQLDVLKEKAAEAAKSLKDTFKVTEHSFFQDGSAEGILNDYNEAMKVWEKFAANKNADGTVNMSVEGAEEAFTLVSTLQSMVDQLNEPVYMELSTSQVEKEMQTPLAKLQEYERLTQTEHQLKLKGTDTSEIEASQEEILSYFENLDPEIKAQLGIQNLSREELQKKIEAGELEIPATVDLQVEMNDTLKDMVNVALYNAGIIDKEELEIRVDASVYAKEVDTSDVENKTEEAVKNAGGDDKKTETTANVDAKAGKVDVSDIENKTEEAIKNASGKTDDIEKSVDLELKINEYNELIENLEDADKDIKIKVTVEGLDQVQELNKNIDLATEIDGDIDNLSEFVEGAKALSKLDSTIVTYVDAEVRGNVLETPEHQINNLKTFAESAKGLEDIKSSTSNVTANVNGNVTGMLEESIDNLKVYSDSAKDVESIGDVKSSVNATITGNVTGMLEESIDNLKAYSDNAAEVESIGEVKSSVEARITGNVTGMLEESIDNLKSYSDNAKDVASIGDVKSSVSAAITGNVTGMLEESIDNLKAYSENAAEVGSIGDVKSSVEARIIGNVTGMLEESIDNLKTYSDSAKNVSDIGDVKSSVDVAISGNVTGMLEESIDNLKTYSDNAKDVADIGEVVSSVDASIDGNVTDLSEDDIDNLKTYSDSAKDVAEIGDVTSSVNAEISGNVTDMSDESIDNLKTYSDNAKDVANIGHVSSDVDVRITGNVTGMLEESIDNLKTYSDSAKDVASIGEVKSSVDVSIVGNVTGMLEESIDNLKVYSDNASEVASIGDVTSSVDARITGNVTGMLEESIDNLKAYSDSAAEVASIGEVNSSVNASISGNVTGMLEESIDNLKAYSDNATEVASIGEVKSSVNATISGNVTGMLEESIDNLKAYSNSAKDVASIGDVTSSVKASITGNVTGMLEESIDNLKAYSDSAKNVSSIGEVTSSVSASISGNVTNMSEGSIGNIGKFADNAAKLKGVGSPASTVTANIEGSATSDKISTLKDFNGIATALKSVGSVVVSVTANVATQAINSAIDLLSKISSSGIFKDYKASVNVTAKVSSVDDTKVQNYQVPSKEGKVTYTVDSSKVDAWTAPPKDGVVNYDASVEALTNAQKHKTGTITYKANIIGLGPAAGTAHVSGSAGTSGRAFARGNWGIKGNGVALGGELGQELVVRDGHFFTIGDQGAEFFKYQNGDIVFNAAQTESLFKYGGIKGAKPRGTMLATGTAFAGGSFPSSGKAFNQSSTGNISGSPVSSWDNSSSSSSSSKSKSSSSDSADEFEETLDWIEIAIDRIERAISRLDLKASSIFKKWSTRNSALVDQIGEVQAEIDLQQRAYERYLQEANSVGLSSSWAQKVRDGKVDIEDITDEDLHDKISEYQDWYEKALDCKDAIEELKETESELYKQRFDNVAEEYDGILANIEYEKNMLEEYISQSEAKGWLTSKVYYEELADRERKTIVQLEKQKADQLEELQAAMESGTIDKYSEAWYEMVNSINDTTLAIEESNTALLEFDKTMRELDWEQFEVLQERIDHITEESEFLIELMSNKKLYEDNGQLTGEGMATMGLHGSGYNVNMHKADMYGAQAAAAKAAWDADPASKELEDYYYEMISLQREHILAAEDEKNAIKDMVEEGIELELDALQELIDARMDALDAEKDMYEYQKKIKEQTEEVASLEKQMAAYSGDDSEETRAKVQELKVSLDEAKQELEETEYDRYISDQEKLLDDLYLEYETILNERLDNLDVLIREMTGSINAKSDEIHETLKGVAGDVGTKLSDYMNTIWKSGTSNNVVDAITTYDGNFRNIMTGTLTAINGIKAYTDMLKKKADDEAAAKAAEAAKKNAAKAAQANAKKKETSSSTTKKQNTSSSGGDGKPKVGDKVKFVSGQYYYDSQGTRPLGSHYQGKEVYITHINNASWATHPYHISTGKKLGSGDLGWLKLNQLSGYAAGKKNFLDDEIAWTQEEGREFIVRPSDGAVLTPIAKGDSVLTAVASNNLWQMANSPADFIKENLNLGAVGAPNNYGGATSVSQNFEQIVISMPNVKNYDEMIRAMQKDKDFENLINSMTFNQMAGKSSLSKGKAIR